MHKNVKTFNTLTFFFLGLPPGGLSPTCTLVKLLCPQGPSIRVNTSVKTFFTRQHTKIVVQRISSSFSDLPFSLKNHSQNVAQIRPMDKLEGYATVSPDLL